MTKHGMGNSPIHRIQAEAAKSEIIEAIRTVYDPELPVNVYDLGLIYQIDVDEDGAANIQMTLTTPACPVAGSLPGDVQKRVAAIPGITDVNVELVWDPPWSPERMSDAARLQLNL